MDSEREQVAHVLRRVSFGPFPGQVEELLSRGPSGVIDLALTTAPHRPPDPLPGQDDYGQTMTRYWLRRMLDRTPSLHERMVWYWHGHLTSGLDKVPERALWRQHGLIRTHALGNFRTLLQAVVTDAAMLLYLDAAGSQGDDPNENLARETMELFALGRDAITEPDVRAAARATAGFQVDGQSFAVTRVAESMYDRPLTIFGIRKRWDLSSFVDAVCDQPSCASHVSRRIYRHLVGVEPAPARLEELASSFRRSGLEIRPLVEAIVRGPEFLSSRRTRPRTPLEWLVPALAVTGNAAIDGRPADRKAGTEAVPPFDVSWLDRLGQMPFRPPNVGGWPADDRWSAAGQVIARASLLQELRLHPQVIDAVAPTVDAMLGHCGLYDVSPTTRSALQRAIDRQTEFDEGLELLVTLALLSPEFALA